MKALVYQAVGKDRLDRPKPEIMRYFKLDRILEAYDTFARGAETKVLKVVTEPDASHAHKGKTDV